ncbi:MAG: hypothetical protein ACSHYA_09730 [Opitutaceae bacterium]
MSASPEELIAINSLLIKREADFARVHTLESQINKLLGGEFPFEPPEVVVPSTIKKKATKAKKAKPKPKPLKPRRLNPGEVAYQMTWLNKGQTTTHQATSLKSLNTLFQESLPEMKLLKIETIDLEGQLVETLFTVESVEEAI